MRTAGRLECENEKAGRSSEIPYFVRLIVFELSKPMSDDYFLSAVSSLGASVLRVFSR